MEDLHCLLRVVFHPSRCLILLGSRDQEPYCKCTDFTISHIGIDKFYVGFTDWFCLQLEELDRIFSAPNPVKASTEKKLYEVDADANILHVDTAEHVSTA